MCMIIDKQLITMTVNMYWAETEIWSDNFIHCDHINKTYVFTSLMYFDNSCLFSRAFLDKSSVT